MRKDIIEITFKNGQKFIFDYDALPVLAAYKFYPVKKHNQWYLYANHKDTTVRFHGIYMGCPQGLEVDHINGNANDNRRKNLRIVNHLTNQNNFVKRPNRGGKSNYRYVYWSEERNIWRVQVTYKGKGKTIGSFSCQKEAAVAANNYILKNKLPKVLNEI